MPSLMETLTQPVLAVRRNHAVEHATLQILARQGKAGPMAGYSDLEGFWIIGTVSTDDLTAAVEEAVQRLKNGESGLAVHPGCGTNYVVSGVAAGSAAWLASSLGARSWRDKLDRWPAAVLLATMALVLSAPLGPLLQARVTTEARLGDYQVLSVTRYTAKSAPTHRILTRSQA